MAKSAKKQIEEKVKKEWREGELIKTFNLNRIVATQTPLMKAWLDVQQPEFNAGEQYIFDEDLAYAQKHIAGWNEEDLKMKFISTILKLGHLRDGEVVLAYFDKTISAEVEGIKLTVKSDFMLAKGILDVFETPYFHFQEYKPNKNPTGDSMAQLLEAFLIAQEKNQNSMLIYGVDKVGKQWTFVVMEGRDYCMSKVYDSVDKTDLLLIVAILRKFKHILDTYLGL